MLSVTIVENELVIEGTPQADEVYQDYCCQGYGFVISLVWPAQAKNDSASGYGSCLNPNCPNWDGTPADFWRGVKGWQVEDFALKIAVLSPTTASIGK